MTAQSGYLDLAQQACEAERKNYWEKAHGLWELAAGSAKKACNKEWASLRAQFCLYQNRTCQYVNGRRCRTQNQ